MKSRVHPKYKTTYRVGNWAEYDRALVRRGDVTLWLTPDAIATWAAAGGAGNSSIPISPRYCQKLWISDRHDQAASFRFFSLVSRSCCRPSMNGTPARTSGSKCALLRRRHRRCAMSSSL